MTHFSSLCQLSPYSAPLFSSEYPPSLYIQFWLAERVRWWLDFATHTDGLYTTGIHKVNFYFFPNDAVLKQLFVWPRVMTITKPSFCFHSKPSSINVPVSNMSLTGPFSAVRPGTLSTPIQEATFNMWEINHICYHKRILYWQMSSFFSFLSGVKITLTYSWSQISIGLPWWAEMWCNHEKESQKYHYIY